ncbi:hypothetical protein [Geothrix campi]|jgi:hypothetical protein|uniref:hypothetical protein n=1 Tax=Geothrix campi TaxID=2966450 RepID=UPI002147A0CF|nr:hypothetical protein [Geothrix sp. SG10]
MTPKKFLAFIATVIIICIIYPGAIKPYLHFEKSTIDLSVVDQDGCAVPNAELFFTESGFRYLIPIPWISPMWHSQKQLKYKTDFNGKCHIVFWDEHLTLNELRINSQIVLPEQPGVYENRSSANHPLYVWTEDRWWVKPEDRWWINSSISIKHNYYGTDCLAEYTFMTSRGYINGNILGHKNKIIITKNNRISMFLYQHSSYPAPNPPLNSDPACIVPRSLSTSRFLGSVQRLGAGGAG